jgi:nitroreductase
VPDMKRPASELMRERFSCRSYLRTPIDEGTLKDLRAFLEGLGPGPFRSRIRFGLLAATAEDERALQGLGTYGMIRNPQGFIVGAMGPGPQNLEDFGYLMERAVLTAVGLGLGTCWLGGSFRKSRFSQSIGAAGDETVPAVVSLGYSADAERSGGWAGRAIKRSLRLAPEKLFFSGGFDRPLGAEGSGVLAPALEAVRWGPSASNKQPWRIVREAGPWHFYLQRTKGYGKGLLGKLSPMADVQRIDLGIAMCHFESAARELGFAGTWELADPRLELPDDLTEYTATWREAPGTSSTPV